MNSDIKPTVSFVIVCMNNLKNLYPCLDSIKTHTTVNYETLVVAYLFSQINLQKLKEDYPWITIIESNEIRGFSENNNLALRQAKGEFCFVLNDDTLFEMPVADKLVDSFEFQKEASIFSPTILNEDNSIQHCGRPPIKTFDFVKHIFNLKKYENIISKYNNQTGIFQTYNISGSAFLIKTEVLRKLNYFDERYFFCPEDIALSTKANLQGYKCYVNEEVKLKHLHGKTSKKIEAATLPASRKGTVIFYSADYGVNKKLLEIIIFLESLIKIPVYIIFWNKIKLTAYRHVMFSIFSSSTPKEIFIRYYKKIV
ncbi:glycosyltransferase [Maribellus sediminis]|uniref:glycosyltransferase n=1 Tax=Maribellus sediminis TaxID=2696285 RepID=UPI001431B6ED|nr:glycosyltransferase [Maribellus sediminis]